MSSFEQYRVGDQPRTIDSNRFRLRSLTRIGNPPSPVSSILIVKSTSNNRKGQEEGDGTATIYLTEPDFSKALDHIDSGDRVNYQSDPITGTNKSSIKNFNFPETEP